MRIGLAGAGRIGALHAQTLSGLQPVDQLLIADVDRGRAAALAVELGATTLDSVADLFAAGLDGLVITAATDAHAGLITKAIEAKLPVFCEKPIAPDAAASADVARRVADAGGLVQIGFQRRFDPGFAAAREQVRSGKLGWVHTIRAGTLDPAPPPPAYLPASGGLFCDCSVHDIDAVRWITGREVVEAYAVGANRGADFFRECGDIDTGAAMLTLDDGTIALVSATRYNAHGYDVRMELFGSERTVVVGLDDRVPLASAEPGARWPDGRPYANFVDRFRAAYVAEMAAFLDVVAGRADSPCTPADALETFYVAEACEQSRRAHRPVAVAEVRG